MMSVINTAVDRFLDFLMALSCTVLVAAGAFGWFRATPFLYASDDCSPGSVCTRPMTCHYAGLDGPKTVVVTDADKCPAFKMIPWGQAAYYDPRPPVNDGSKLVCKRINGILTGRKPKGPYTIIVPSGPIGYKVPFISGYQQRELRVSR